MEIITNYQGSSIKIIKNKEQENTIELSLKKEKDKYSHYYNFTVNNDSKREGKIYLYNTKLSAYYNKNLICLPYIKKENEDWKKIDKKYYEVEGEKVKIKIPAKEKLEISLVPRYTENDLEKFLKTISISKNVIIDKKKLTKIEIGERKLPTIFVIARQHPGETLSSFFVEGMIEATLKNTELAQKFHFVFYPISNIEGVKNGNHRYTNGVDFNRSWNLKNPPEEIKFLKQEMESYNMGYFIDVHNDEITSKDYLRINNKFILQDEIAGIRVLETVKPFRRFVRALIKQRKIISLKNKTARSFVEKKYKCKSILIELSMNEEYKKVKEKGKKFVLELFGGKNEK